MHPQLQAIAARVIKKADRAHPADAVLRQALKESKAITREDSRNISQAVFGYYRWRGWLDKNSPVENGIRRAMELDRSFQSRPKKLPDEELQRAVPDWIRGEMQVTAPWLRSLQTEPTLWLRARVGQGRELARKLDSARLGPGGLTDALVYEGREDLFRTQEFNAGEFEVQDLSSQMVGLVCNPQPGEFWWDACAGEGGKTLHLCDLMQNKGLVWATDRAEWRLQRLKRRAARAELFNYRSATWDGGPQLPTKTKFDGILVDAPCTGVGTWQRNPQARWTTSPEDVRELSAAQLRLLAAAVPALKPGGRLIYAVCTLTRVETEHVADAISTRFPELGPLALANPSKPETEAKSVLRLWPQDTGGNGMFVCGWRKSGRGRAQD